LARAASPPLMLWMDSSGACATSWCALPTVDESSHSGAGMLHPHCSATFFLYITMRCPIPCTKKFTPSHWRIPTYTIKKVIQQSHHPKRHNRHTYTELLLLLFMYNKVARIYRMSLLYSTTLLNVTVIHSCPFCALNFTFAWQAIIAYFLLCQTPTINVQAYFWPLISVCTLTASKKSILYI